jgi:hypothetical protein
MHFTGHGFILDILDVISLKGTKTLGAMPNLSQVMGSSYQNKIFAKMIKMNIWII